MGAKFSGYSPAMNFNSLSNSVLHEETISAAKSEKAATLRLLEFLAEVDFRRLYCERGYSSLFASNGGRTKGKLKGETTFQIHKRSMLDKRVG